MLLDHIIQRPEHADIAATFSRWCGYMEAHLDFSLPDSPIHTMPHCARVLFLALTIARREGFAETKALAHAAIFHDTRRRDDGRDVGHGARAASHYLNFCTSRGDIAYLPLAAALMTWHDQPDADGVKAISARSYGNPIWLAAYRIFKDADALDRVRLGDLNPAMLRTQSARGMVDFAEGLYRDSAAGQ